MKSNSDKVVTRFAPSPTGFMHIGNVRTALFAWAFARKTGGTFILRIEDTDKAREVEGSIDHIIESLKWIGLEWNEGPDIGGEHAPYLQSERLDTYKKYAEMLIDKGHAYADPYTPEELSVFRKKAEEEKRPFLYRDHRPDISSLPRWDGTKALRFKTPSIKSYKWNDLARGELSAGEEALDDFILIKSDGYPTYNFAHIIDDLLMGVTHIFRGDEFISSTPKFLSLYEALEIAPPEFVSLSPILGTEGTKKLGKRDGAKDMLEYRDEGYLPGAMFNYLAFIGWNPGDEREVFTKDEFLGAFDISGIQKAGGKSNDEKLNWFNKEHMSKLSDAAFILKAKDFVPEKIKATSNFEKVFTKAAPVIRERISYFGEILTPEISSDLECFFIEPAYEKELLLCPEKQRKGKDVTLDSLVPIFEKLKECISSADGEITPEYAKTLIWEYAEIMGRGIVLWALRVALSGKERSPDPFTLISVLGKEESLHRLNAALSKLK